MISYVHYTHVYYIGIAAFLLLYPCEFFPLAFVNHDLILLIAISYFWDEYDQWINLLTTILNFKIFLAFVTLHLELILLGHSWVITICAHDFTFHCSYTHTWHERYHLLFFHVIILSLMLSLCYLFVIWCYSLQPKWYLSSLLCGMTETTLDLRGEL